MAFQMFNVEAKDILPGDRIYDKAVTESLYIGDVYFTDEYFSSITPKPIYFSVISVTTHEIKTADMVDGYYTETTVSVNVKAANSFIGVRAVQWDFDGDDIVSVIRGFAEPEEMERHTELGSCGCIDYHYADCPIRTG